MKILNYFFLIILIITSCSKDPNTGISSNPNFIKGTVLSKDQKPVIGAFVTISRDEFSKSTETDTLGEFAIEVEIDQQYSLDVTYNDELIYHTENITSTSEEDLVITSDLDSTGSVNTVPIDTADTQPTDTNTTLADTTDTDTTEQNTESFNADGIYYDSLTTDNFDDAYIKYDLDDSGVTDAGYVFGGKMDMYLGYEAIASRNSRMFIRINEFNTTLEYTKVLLQFNVEIDLLTTVETIKVYEVLRDWSETEISAKGPFDNETWDSVGVAINGKDVTESPLFTVLTSEVIDDNKFTLDITYLYNKWKGEGDNYGIMITFSEEFLMNSSYLSFSTSESLSPPRVILYK